jgi:hypothetical protein
MQHRTASPRIPKGLAFDISDHVRAGRWAAANDFRLKVDIGYGVEDEEYEEVLLFYTGQSDIRPSDRRLWCVMWRQSDCIVVQPVVGRAMRYRSVRAALEGLKAVGR